MKSHYLASGFMLMVVSAVAGFAADMADYVALANAGNYGVRMTPGGDLRVMVQNFDQLSFLQKNNLILITLSDGGKVTRFFAQPGTSVKEAIELSMKTYGLKKLVYESGNFRFAAYPTANITVYGESVIFRNRPYPITLHDDVRKRHEMMMGLELYVGDVVVIDLTGPS